MIFGGSVKGISDKMTEVVDLTKTNSAPSFGQLPSIRLCAVGAILGNVPIICGGVFWDWSSYDTCLSFQNSTWTQSHVMNKRRSMAPGVKINSTTIWIIGGIDWFPTPTQPPITHDTTEFIIQGQIHGVPGPKLPNYWVASCAVKLSDEEIFVIGGTLESVNTNEVWIYNPMNEFTRKKGPYMNNKRGCHSCSTMRDGEKTLIIVAGGSNEDGSSVLDSVEIYDPTDNSWRSGKTRYHFMNLM